MEFLDDWLAQPDGHANRLVNQGKTARGLFVIGTDTEVGKSYVASLMIRHLVALGLDVGAYKPVASGVPLAGPTVIDQVVGDRANIDQVVSQPTVQDASDAEQLWRASGCRWPIERICPQQFEAAVAPPVAARREGRRVDEQLLRSGVDWWRSRCDVLVVEGAGGGLSPLGDQTTVLDLASDLKYPVVLVAEHRLGMMNHTLLTLEALERRGLELLALIVNHVQPGQPPATDRGRAEMNLSETSSSETQLSETLDCLLPFCQRILCGKISCWVLEHAGSALSRAGR